MLTQTVLTPTADSYTCKSFLLLYTNAIHVSIQENIDCYTHVSINDTRGSDQ